MRIEIEWGNDSHDCPMASRTWRRILAGKPVRRVEPFVHEGRRFVAEWLFNHRGMGSLRMTHEGDGTGFDGMLQDALVEIDGERVLCVELRVPERESASSPEKPGKWRAIAFPLLPSGIPGFTASQTGGPDVDLIALLGISFTDAEEERMELFYGWEEIVTECGGYVDELEEFEGGPGQSDTFYNVQVDDPKQFVERWESSCVSEQGFQRLAGDGVRLVQARLASCRARHDP